MLCHLIHTKGLWLRLNPFSGPHPNSFLLQHAASLYLDFPLAQHVITLSSKKPTETFTSNLPSCYSLSFAYHDESWFQNHKWMGFWKAELSTWEAKSGKCPDSDFRRLESGLEIFLPSIFFSRENSLGWTQMTFLLLKNKEICLCNCQFGRY